MKAITPLVLIGALIGSSIATQAHNETFTIADVTDQVASFLELLTNGSAGVTERAVPTGCFLACSFLNFVTPGKIAYPGSPVFASEEEGYWSAQQRDVESTCRFSPTSTHDVSLAVLVFQVTQCKFAVKSGGHSAFVGASNIDAGVTIDLINLNQITVSADRKQASIGPGNRWVNVYERLTPMGLTVIGGRVNAIGSGLLLGGGISFLSARFGWACDNTNNYQVVFADGSIRDVSYATYPDLFFALRGGGNNFGIVTRFDIVAYEQGLMWGGSQDYIYNPATATAINAAFSNLNVNNAADPFAQAILAYTYYQPYYTYLISSEFTYGKPVVNPPILKPFTDVPGAISSTVAIANLTTLVALNAAGNPDGLRQHYVTLMTKDSPSLMAEMTAIWMEEVDPIKNIDVGFQPSLAYQPISTSHTEHFTKQGGNALGISASDGPLILINFIWSWNATTSDTAVLLAASNVLTRCNATAYAQGLGHRFLYQNYAALKQPVFKSYGETNLEKLKKASKKYDPNGVWWKLQPGYFKLGL